MTSMHYELCIELYANDLQGFIVGCLCTCNVASFVPLTMEDPWLTTFLKAPLLKGEGPLKIVTK